MGAPTYLCPQCLIVLWPGRCWGGGGTLQTIFGFGSPPLFKPAQAFSTLLLREPWPGETSCQFMGGRVFNFGGGGGGGRGSIQPPG